MYSDRLLLGETLIAVLEAGSFSGAASALGVGQSTVSRRIAALETSLGGVPLFRRGTRWIEPTPEAESYSQSIRQTIGQLEAAEARITDQSGEPRGLLRISVPPALGRAKFAVPLAKLASTYPELHVKIDFTENYVDLREGSVDIAIRIRSIEQSGIVVEKLGESRVCVFASPDYLGAYPPIAKLADLVQHHIIGLASFFGRTAKDKARSPSRDMAQIRPAVIVNDLEAIRSMLLAGLGIGFLPNFLVANDVREGKLTRCVPSPPVEKVEIFAMHPFGLRGARRIETAMETLRSVDLR